MDTIDRFAQRIEVQEDECWLWVSYKSTGGYGFFRVNGKIRLAHRLAYEWAVGPIPEGLEIDHLCRNRACVNPDHLEPVTHAENMLRAPSHAGTWQAAKTHCPQGHAYDEHGSRYSTNGHRRCRECHRIRENERYHRKMGHL